MAEDNFTLPGWTNSDGTRLTDEELAFLQQRLQEEGIELELRHMEDKSAEKKDRVDEEEEVTSDEVPSPEPKAVRDEPVVEEREIGSGEESIEDEGVEVDPIDEEPPTEEDASSMYAEASDDSVDSSMESDEGVVDNDWPEDVQQAAQEKMKWVERREFNARLDLCLNPKKLKGRGDVTLEVKRQEADVSDHENEFLSIHARVLQWQEHNRHTPLYPGRRGCVRGKSSGSNRWEGVQSNLLRELPFGVCDGAEDSSEEERQLQRAIKRSIVAFEIEIRTPAMPDTPVLFPTRGRASDTTRETSEGRSTSDGSENDSANVSSLDLNGSYTNSPVTARQVGPTGNGKNKLSLVLNRDALRSLDSIMEEPDAPSTVPSPLKSVKQSILIENKDPTALETSRSRDQSVLIEDDPFIPPSTGSTLADNPKQQPINSAEGLPVIRVKPNLEVNTRAPSTAELAGLAERRATAAKRADITGEPEETPSPQSTLVARRQGVQFKLHVEQRVHPATHKRELRDRSPYPSSPRDSTPESDNQASDTRSADAQADGIAERDFTLGGTTEDSARDSDSSAGSRSSSIRRKSKKWRQKYTSLLPAVDRSDPQLEGENDPFNQDDPVTKINTAKNKYLPGYANPPLGSLSPPSRRKKSVTIKDEVLPPARKLHADERLFTRRPYQKLRRSISLGSRRLQAPPGGLGQPKQGTIQSSRAYVRRSLEDTRRARQTALLNAEYEVERLDNVPDQEREAALAEIAEKIDNAGQGSQNVSPSANPPVTPTNPSLRRSTPSEDTEVSPRTRRPGGPDNTPMVAPSFNVAAAVESGAASPAGRSRRDKPKFKIIFQDSNPQERLALPPFRPSHGPGNTPLVATPFEHTEVSPTSRQRSAIIPQPYIEDVPRDPEEPLPPGTLIDEILPSYSQTLAQQNDSAMVTSEEIPAERVDSGPKPEEDEEEAARKDRRQRRRERKRGRRARCLQLMKQGLRATGRGLKKVWRETFEMN